MMLVYPDLPSDLATLVIEELKSKSSTDFRYLHHYRGMPSGITPNESYHNLSFFCNLASGASATIQHEIKLQEGNRVDTYSLLVDTDHIPVGCFNDISIKEVYDSIRNRVISATMNQKEKTILGML